jgi:hypothetical protein
MALKGTIKDFGIADIFQLIGQQVKTGVLVLNNDVDEVRVYFRDGTVIRAENASRPEQMLLGTFMVRAEVISQAQLDTALKEQRRTLKRIGPILVELNFADERTITEFATLQMTETIHALFEWKQGTYQFETTDVETSPEGVQPIRSETIVMNGIRMADEWPSIRERIPAYAWTVERMRPLPPRRDKTQPRSDEFDLSDFDEFSAGQSDFDQIGPYERRVFDLIASGRTVQSLIDMSRLGEFETCRSISVLMGEGYVRVIKPPDLSEDIGLNLARGLSPGRIVGSIGRLLVSSTLVVIAGLLVGQVGRAPAGAAVDGTLRYSPTIVHRHVSESQLRVLRRALEVHRLQTGRYPAALDDLVTSGVVAPHDIRFPYDRPYFYRIEDNKPILLPPIP